MGGVPVLDVGRSDSVCKNAIVQKFQKVREMPRKAMYEHISWSKARNNQTSLSGATDSIPF